MPPSPSSSWSVKHPSELVKAGYEAEPPATLEGTPAFLAWQAELAQWIERLPGLRTPRLPDGSGGTPPKPHQLRHAAIGLQRRSTLFAWSMGTGKTALSILHILGWYGRQLFAGLPKGPDVLAYWLAKRGEEATHAYLLSRCTLPPGSIQIVLPRHVRNVWVKELARMNLGWACAIIEREDQLATCQAPIWIYHYDWLREQSTKGKAMKRAQGGLRFKPDGAGLTFWGHPLAKVVAKRHPPSLLILDEVHRLREGTLRTQLLALVRAKAKRVLALTGTPMDGWVHQVATLLGITHREHSPLYPFDNQDFAKRFTRTGAITVAIATGAESGEARIRPVPGINHSQIPAFLKATRHLMHRLNLQDPEVKANVAYPPVKSHKLVLTMDFAQQVFYQDHYREGLKAIQDSFKHHSGARLRMNMLSLMNGLRLASSAPWSQGFQPDRTALLEALLAIVGKHAAEGRKGLIGTTFIEESRMLHAALQQAGFKGVRLYASDPALSRNKTLSASAREELLETFQDDPACVYLIANKELVAEGLNLAETASYTVSCSSGYRPYVETQWLHRVVRPGQVHPHVDAYRLMNAGTIDLYIDQLLQRKLAATAAMVDLDFSLQQDDAGTMLDPVDLAVMLLNDQAA